MTDLIQKKKIGSTLTKGEIDFIVSGITEGTIPDYQAAAWLMAVYFQGLDRGETYDLTEAMLRSGDRVDLSSLSGVTVDKHSTGGVGDTTTLIAAPLAAACGVPVAKMSGRGLGFTGGTIDKLEAIPGFRVQLSQEAFLDTVSTVGMAIMGQSADIAAADKALYALRDVTATVDSIPLIAGSIMSKKLASGCQAIVLDVKCGSGSFMKREEQAAELARLMVDIGRDAGRTTLALITSMEQPLGLAVGNTLEVMEACDVLQGRGPDDIRELSLLLAGYMICAGKKASSAEEGRALAEEALSSGTAFRLLQRMVEAQGGDSSVLEDYRGFKQAQFRVDVPSPAAGRVQAIAADGIGLASLHLGAGRRTKEETIDLSAGLLLHKKVGDAVEKGEALCTLYTDEEGRLDQGLAEAVRAFQIGEGTPARQPLLLGVVDS